MVSSSIQMKDCLILDYVRKTGIKLGCSSLKMKGNEGYAKCSACPDRPSLSSSRVVSNRAICRPPKLYQAGLAASTSLSPFPRTAAVLSHLSPCLTESFCKACRRSNKAESIFSSIDTSHTAARAASCDPTPTGGACTASKRCHTLIRLRLKSMAGSLMIVSCMQVQQQSKSSPLPHRRQPHPHVCWHLRFYPRQQIVHCKWTSLGAATPCQPLRTTASECVGSWEWCGAWGFRGTSQVK